VESIASPLPSPPLRPSGPAGSSGPADRRIRARGASYVSLGRSAAAHLRLIIALAVLGLAVGSVYGLVRSPNYSAEARLIVGKSITITNEAATAGLPAAAAQFASDYSRLAGTEAVDADAAKRLGEKVLKGGLTASPIPDSPIIRVDATASSQAGAVALANAGAQAIIDQVNAINQTNQYNLSALAQTFKQDEFQLYQDTQTEQNLEAQLSAGGGDSALQTQLDEVKSQVAEDQLQANAAQTQYDDQYSPVQSDAQVVTLASGAAPTGSDRLSYLEIGVVAGLFGGIILGIALGALIDLRRPAPRLAAATNRG
jgi:hypothetical protein